MSPTSTALAVEWSKFHRSPVSGSTTLILALGVMAVTGASVASVGADGLLAAKSQVLIGDGGWAGLFGIAGQVVAAGGMLGFGVMAGWMHGREFTDGTVAALFAHPVSLRSVATAKLVLYLAWALAVSVAVTIALLALGAVLALGGSAGFESGAAARPAATLLVVSVLTALLALPCAWVATLTRGYLAAVGAAITIVVLAQMSVLLGLGGWFPFAAPGLWVVQAGALDVTTVTQLAMALPVAAAAAALTLRTWANLTL